MPYEVKKNYRKEKLNAINRDLYTSLRLIVRWRFQKWYSFQNPIFFYAIKNLHILMSLRAAFIKKKRAPCSQETPRLAIIWLVCCDMFDPYLKTIVPYLLIKFYKYSDIVYFFILFLNNIVRY